jgi:hypothetical protein
MKHVRGEKEREILKSREDREKSEAEKRTSEAEMRTLARR